MNNNKEGKQQGFLMCKCKESCDLSLARVPNSQQIHHKSTKTKTQAHSSYLLTHTNTHTSCRSSEWEMSKNNKQMFVLAACGSGWKTLSLYVVWNTVSKRGREGFPRDGSRMRNKAGRQRQKAVKRGLGDFYCPTKQQLKKIQQMHMWLFIYLGLVKPK